MYPRMNDTTVAFLATTATATSANDQPAAAALTTPAPVSQEPRALSLAELEQATGDYGDAELLKRVFRDQLVFDRTAGAWYRFNGVCWRADTDGFACRCVSGTLAAMYRAGVRELEHSRTSEMSTSELKAIQDRIRGLLAKETALHSTNKVKAVLEALSNLVGMSLVGEAWDQHGWLLPCANGVVDLRTGTLCPANPRDYLKSCAPTKFEGLDTPCPRWLRFLDEVFNHDQDVIDFMQRFLGYSTSGIVKDAVMPFLYGPTTRNGKTTIDNTMQYTLGLDFVTELPADALMLQKYKTNAGPTPYTVMLQGKRLVFFSESAEGSRIDAALIKLLTGNDSITARGLYEKPRTFRPTHKLCLLTNHAPDAPADDQGVWERVLLVEFTQRFIDNPHPDRAVEHAKDNNLDATLQAEASGILAWLVAGCLAWQRDGLRVPETIRLNTSEWREQNDDVAQWLEACCAIDANQNAGANMLYKSFCDWYSGKTFVTPNMSQKKFSIELARRFNKKRTMYGNFFYGLGLKT